MRFYLILLAVLLTLFFAGAAAFGAANLDAQAASDSNSVMSGAIRGAIIGGIVGGIAGAIMWALKKNKK